MNTPDTVTARVALDLNDLAKTLVENLDGDRLAGFIYNLVGLRNDKLWEAEVVAELSEPYEVPAPSSEDTPPPVRDDAWTDFEWPDWVPAKTQAEIERFWEARAGRDPSAWQRNSHHNKAPHLGEVVTLPAMKLGKEDLRTGRFVFCWNNIGRLIHDDGTVSYVSFGPDWATRYTPLSEVPTPGGTT